MAGRRQVGKVLVLLAVALLGAAGCSIVRGSVATVRALDQAGFKNADVQLESNDTYRVGVEKDTEDLDAAAAEAAGVVWRKLPLRIERLEVTCRNGFGGRGAFRADRRELETRFGPRDADLDRGIQETEVRDIALVVVGLLVAGLLVLVGIVVLVLVLVRRSKRRNPPPGPPGPGPGAGWGTQPPPPGYGP